MRWLERKTVCLLTAVLLVCAALCRPAAAERWRWSGGGLSGSVDVRTFGNNRMAAADEIAKELGYAAVQEQSELVVKAGTGLRFVHGAAVVWLGYSVIPLPSRTRVESGHWWIDTDSVLRIFSQFLRKNGRSITLRWSGAGEPKKIAPPPAEKKPSPPPVQPKVSVRLPRVKNVRWGGDEHVRAVLDLEGEEMPLYSTEGAKTSVQADALSSSEAARLSGSREGVTLSVKSGDPSRLDFSHPGYSVKIFTLKAPYRLVMDFRRDSQSAPKVLPPQIDSPQPGRNTPPPEPQKKIELPPVKKDLPPAVKSPKAKKRKLVVIDAGHGGKDPGAMAHGYREKVIALQIATKIAAELRELGVNVKMTRTGDTYPTLKERTAMANRWNADVFISVHLNALPKGRHSNGVEIYIMALPTDKDAMALAKIENAEIAESGSGKKSAKADKRTEMLLAILGNMQQNQKISESTLLAEDLFQSGQKSGLDMKRVAQAPFWVLRGAAMPAVLIETGFITELAEVRRLAQPAYQQRMAEAFAAGIVSFINR